MPTPLVNGDILRVTVACRMPTKAQNGLNVLHYKVTATGGANLEAVPLAFYNRVVTQYAGWLPSICSFWGVSVSTVFPINRKAGPFYQVFPQAGLASTGMVPMQASGLIRLTTSADPATVPPTKPGKGRVYIPFLATTSYNDSNGLLLALGTSRLDAIRAVLGPSITLTGGVALQMVCRRTKTNPRPAPPTFLGYTDVTQLQTLRAIATQRRRGDFGKINAAFGAIN